MPIKISVHEPVEQHIFVSAACLVSGMQVPCQFYLEHAFVLFLNFCFVLKFKTPAI